MNVKDKLLKVIKSRKSIRTLAAALALTTTLSGCGIFKDNNNHDLPEEPSVSYEQNIDDEHNHEDDHIVIETPTIDDTTIEENPIVEEPIVEDEEKNILDELGISIDEDGHYVINGLVIPDLSNSSYKGVSIVDALYKEGYRYDREYLHALAKHFGIENYRGTAEQNTYLLKCLRTWVLELGLEQLKPVGPTTENPTNPVNPIPTDPVVTDPTINEDHVHQFGEWYSINDLLEESTCPDCGEKSYRAHKYEWTEWITSDDKTMEVKTGTCLNCGHIVTQTRPLPTPEHHHEFGEWIVVKEPTCTEEGITERTCLECGEKEARVVPKSKHNFGGWSAWTPWSTPDKDNIQTRTRTMTCKTCGEQVTETQTRTYIPPQPGHTHNWTGWTIETPATCETDGLKVNICKKCGEKITQIIKAFGHTWDGGVVTLEPTETSEGVRTYTCEVCGKTKTETIPRLQHTEHNWSEWTTVIEPTYDEEGLEERVCSICGEKETNKIPKKPRPSHEHTWGAWHTTKVATCTQDGEETRQCTSCGETEQKTLAALGHDWSEWNVIKQPTETDDGLKERTCSRCNEKETEVIPALGHTHVWGEWTTTKQPTCTTAGERTRTCQSGHTQTEVIPALGHNEVADPAVAATCTEAGKTAGSHCSRCGEVIVAQEVISVLGHDHGEFTQTKAPTCSAEGEEQAECKRCGNIITRTIAKLAHVARTIAGVEATCDSTGLTDGSVCDVCGETITAQETIPALGHAYVETGRDSYDDDLEGIHVEEITYVCSRCGHSYTDRNETSLTFTLNNAGVEIKEETTDPATVVPEQTGDGPDPKKETNTELGVDGSIGIDTTLPETDGKSEDDEQLIDKKDEELNKSAEEGKPAEGESKPADEEGKAAELPAECEGKPADEESQEETEDLEEAYNEYVELVTELQEVADTKDDTYSEGGMSLTLTPEA